MQTTEIFRSILALAAGGLIGSAFGYVQNLALRRHQKAQNTAAGGVGAVRVIGSMRRVAYLLMLLVLIQVLCPLLFVNGSQWWVSAGVVFGYGASLFSRLRYRDQAAR